MIVIAASKSSGIKEIFFFFFLRILLFAVGIQNKEKRWPTKICYLLNATSIIILEWKALLSIFFMSNNRQNQLDFLSIISGWFYKMRNQLILILLLYNGSNVIWQSFSGNFLSLSSYVTAWLQHYSFGCLRRKVFLCSKSLSKVYLN